MPQYPETRGFEQPRQEEETLRWWDENAIFEQTIALREGAPAFVFYEGPPTANGQPGIHHVMARTIKDLFCRYKTMKGFRVDRKAGWDTHGLPVEIEVEKELGLEGRHQVEAYGIARYNAACRRSVLRYKDRWDALTRRMGYWVDLSNPYLTFENAYIESVWNLLKRIHEKGLLYKGYKIQWYSPGSGTVLSSHEVSLGYQEIQDPSLFVRFPVTGEDGTYFLAWTTTPWTLPSNAALAVGEDIDYVRIRIERDEGAERLYLARDLLGIIAEDYQVEAAMKGRDLVGKSYEPVFDFFLGEEGAERAWRVVAADFVSTEDGTGIVHMAPAFGADDFTVGQREGLPVLNPIAPDGRFTEKVPLVAGQWFKDADRALARDLRERGLLYRHETYRHNYPHDWRKGTPLMAYPVESWFIRTTAIKDRMVALNRTINWQPEAIGEGRFGQWLENNVDWAISRMRFWGTPLPIWVNDANQDDVLVIGSIEELRARAGGAFPQEAINPETAELDLHRPFVDAIVFPAPGGGRYRRVPDLLDVWFDSGAMPFAQWHYPFENQEVFRRNFPADFIAEGVDQTRGWFYTLHAIAALVEDSVAYKNVVVNGLVLDEHGEKMSKAKGNVVDPFETLRSHGADPVRWAMMSASAPWDNVRYADRTIEEVKRRLFGTVTNTYSFFATYANLDGFAFDPRAEIRAAERTELDRWILSRLHASIAAVDAALQAYHPTQAARAVETFVEELSNWYVRRSRRRFWKSEDDTDKRLAYDTTYRCLAALARLMAPIAPFYGEWLYRALGEDARAAPSVHLTDFPVADEALIDAGLEARMGLARRVASLALALRNEAGINVRQPLPALAVVVGAGGVDEGQLRAVEPIILDEVNVKRLDPIPSDSALVARSARPNFRALGRRLGPLMKPATAAIRALSPQQIAAYERTGALTLILNGEAVTFHTGELEITSEGVAGRLVAQEDGLTVSLDTTVDERLRKEGLAREVIHRIQNLRKQAGYAIADRISVTFSASGMLAEALSAHAETIRAETLALSLEPTSEPAGDVVESFDVAGQRVCIALCRARAGGAGASLTSN